MSEDRREERLRWRCRRGLLELDILLKDFLEKRYSCLSTKEQTAFEELLNFPDDLLLAYLQGSKIPEKELIPLVDKIRN